MQAMKDKAFLEEAEKLQIDIEPMDGASTARIIDSFYSTPASVIDRLQPILH
jgi:hypothetical protein